MVYDYNRTTLRNFRNALRKYFNFAFRQKYITDNPMIQLADYDIGKGEEKMINRSETISAYAKKVIRYIMNHKTSRSFSLQHKVQILLTLDGCLRPIELAALTWGDINLEEASMDINKDLSVLTNKEAEELKLPRISFTDTKTGASKRLLPLSKITVQMLKEYKKESESFLRRTGAKNPKGYLFFQRRNIIAGNQVEVAYGNSLRSRLHTVSRYLQTPIISPYDLRRLARTERENDMVLKDRVNKYVIGHVKENETADPRYITSMYSHAKKSHPIWEKILMSIITENNVNKTKRKTN